TAPLAHRHPRPGRLTMPNRLTGPDFLDSVADQNDAQGLPVNAAEFRQRATEWRADQARIEQLEADLARLERDRRSQADRTRIIDELKSHLQAANEALAATTTTAADAA